MGRDLCTTPYQCPGWTDGQCHMQPPLLQEETTALAIFLVPQENGGSNCRGNFPEKLPCPELRGCPIAGAHLLPRQHPSCSRHKPCPSTKGHKEFCILPVFVSDPHQAPEQINGREPGKFLPREGGTPPPAGSPGERREGESFWAPLLAWPGRGPFASPREEEEGGGREGRAPPCY